MILILLMDVHSKLDTNATWSTIKTNTELSELEILEAENEQLKAQVAELLQGRRVLID